MASLESIRLEAYRAFGDATLSLLPVGLTLVVGANNSGKSCLLSAIDALRGVEVPQPAENSAGGRPAAITATFALSDGERSDIFLDASEDWVKSKAFTRLRLQLAFTPTRFCSLEVTDARGEFQPLAALLEENTNQQVVALKLRQHLAERSPQDPFRLSAVVSGSGLTRYLMDADIGLNPVTGPIKDWLGHVYHLESLRPGTSRKRQSSGHERLVPTGENLPEVLLALASGETSEWQQIRAVMADLVPDAGRLLTPVRGGEVELVFEDDSGIRRNLQDLGTGVEQLLMAAVVGVTHDAGGLLMIEEPETNLHPGAQRALLRRMTEWATTRQILATTHSTVFLDQSGDRPPSVWLVTREGSRSNLSGISPNVGLLDSLGVRLSDVLTAERLLLVEGPTDIDLTETWFRGFLAEKRIEIVQLRGSDAARNAERFELVGGTGPIALRPMLFMRDRDELPPTAITGLEKSGHVRVLPVREIENFLLDPSAIRSALASRIASTPHDQEIHERLQALSLELRERVVLLRVVSQLGPIYPAPWSQIGLIKSPRPTLEELLSVIDLSLTDVARVRDKAKELWETAAADVYRDWDEHWQAIAPGSELLVKLWGSFGLAYQKGRDAVEIAANVPAPGPIRSILQELAQRSTS